MTEKERFAHHVRAEFGACNGQAILDRIARWDAETARRKSNYSLETYSLQEKPTLQTSLPFGRRKFSDAR